MCEGDTGKFIESIGKGDKPPKLLLGVEGVGADGEKSSGDLTPSELESSSKLP